MFVMSINTKSYHRFHGHIIYFSIRFMVFFRCTLKKKQIFQETTFKIAIVLICRQWTLRQKPSDNNYIPHVVSFTIILHTKLFLAGSKLTISFRLLQNQCLTHDEQIMTPIK